MRPIETDPDLMVALLAWSKAHTARNRAYEGRSVWMKDPIPEDLALNEASATLGFYARRFFNDIPATKEE